jgi:hypothetical protein
VRRDKHSFRRVLPGVQHCDGIGSSWALVSQKQKGILHAETPRANGHRGS